ncbi:MAG: hypothetical protein D6707_12260 [Bacteroidetes bacterium]|nr:MAG: hypothetical protein D6707_12260 [Bacteroidota bacterium]
MEKSFQNLLKDIQELIDKLKSINPDLTETPSEKMIEELQQTSRVLLDKLAVYRYLLIHSNISEQEQPSPPQPEENQEELLISSKKEPPPSLISEEKENKMLKDWLKSNIAKEDLNEKLKKNALSDLKNVIGLNEKILFMKEFFNGNKEQYNEFIASLNKAASYDEAQNIIEQYAIPREKDAFQVLDNLLEIRYS